MAKKPHPADIAAQAAIAAASEFSVLMYFHRNRLVEHGFPTMAAAAARCNELEQEHKPKKALIYALSNGVLVPVPDALRAADSAQPVKEGPTMDTLSIFSEVHKTRVMAREALKLLEDRPDYGDLRIIPAKDQPGYMLCHKAAIIKPTNLAAKKTPAEAGAKKKKKAAPQPEAAKSERKSRHDEEQEKAKAGKVPAEPDFSAPSRERYRAKLKSITALIKAKDIKGLKALAINPADSANKIMARYRAHAVLALEAKA